MSDLAVNFRGTLGYVTDGVNEVAWLGEIYPTTKSGLTGGWDIATITPADRNTFFDRRIDGINFDSVGGPGTFRLDLTAIGQWVLHTALGDAFGGGNASNTCTIKDNTSTVATIPFAANVGNKFTDATGVQYNEVTWPGNESGLLATFTSTILNVVMTSVGFWTIAHFRAIAVGTAALTGSALSAITSSDVVAGGKDIIITLTSETFVGA